MTTHTKEHNHGHEIDFKTAFSVSPLEKSQVKIEGEVPYDEVLKEKSAAIKSLGKNLKVDGFRKGHIPDSIIEKTVGEARVLAEMAERTISHLYYHIIDAHEVNAVGYPKVEITKIAPKNPLGFSLTVAVIPEIALPDYKKIAKKINQEKTEVEITPEVVEEQIKDILRRKVAFERLQNIQKGTAEKRADDKEEKGEVKEADLPELTDDLVKTLGQPGQFNTVAEFKEKIKEHLEIEKKQENVSNHRVKLTDAILEKVEVEIPQILIDHEINQMFAQMEDDLAKSGLKLKDYLEHIKKTKEDLTKEWTDGAEKRAKLQIILNEIAVKEKITAKEEDVKEKVKELLNLYKEANPHNVITYVTTILTNEAIMTFLEAEK